MSGRRVRPPARIEHQVPRVAAVVIHSVQILHVFVHEYANDLEMRIGPIRETRLMQGRATQLVLGL